MQIAPTGVISEPIASSEWSPGRSRATTPRITSGREGVPVQPERAGSANNSRASTPEGGHARGGGLLGVGLPRVAPLGPRSMQDNIVLAEMRRQVEGFEDKICNQIDKMHARSEKQRSIEVSRLEDKISIAEGSLPKLERRMAELSGNSKGLSDELQAQIRRVDVFEERLWEWRHQMEQDLSRKQTELEQKLSKMSSEARIAVAAIAEKQEKQAQKLHKHELSRQDLHASHDDARQGLLHLHERLSTVERQSVETSTVTSRGFDLQGTKGFEPQASSSPLMCERQLEDLDSKVQKMVSTIHDVHSQIATQGEVLKSLKTRFDTKEENWRCITERVERLNLESKLESMQQTLAEESRQRLANTEHLAVITKSLKDQEEAFNELYESHALPLLSGSPSAVQASIEDTEIANHLSNHAMMLQHLGDRLGAVEAGTQASHESSQLGSRVGELVSHLQNVVPRVVEHENKIQQLGDQHLQDILPRLVEQEGKINRLGEQHSGLAEKVTKHFPQLPMPHADNNTSNNDTSLHKADDTLCAQRYDKAVQRIEVVSYNLSLFGERVLRSEQDTVELKRTIEQCQEKTGSQHANMRALPGLSYTSKVQSNAEDLNDVASDLQKLVDKVHTDNQYSHKEMESQIKVKNLNTAIGRIANIQASLPINTNGENVQTVEPQILGEC